MFKFIKNPAISNRWSIPFRAFIVSLSFSLSLEPGLLCRLLCSSRHPSTLLLPLFFFLVLFLSLSLMRAPLTHTPPTTPLYSPLVPCSGNSISFSSSSSSCSSRDSPHAHRSPPLSPLDSLTRARARLLAHSLASILSLLLALFVVKLFMLYILKGMYQPPFR